MPLIKLATAFISLFVAVSAHAFNKDRCGDLFPKSDDSHPPYYSPLYVSTMIPSTTSYFSSFGPCSMYASSMSLRKAFIENSRRPLQADAARGQGEYLNALAELSGCPSAKYFAFATLMHNKYDVVFSSPDSTLSQKIDFAIQSEPSLSGSCVF
jgi:hypothetical protein